jgi:hypothetical protein
MVLQIKKKIKSLTRFRSWLNSKWLDHKREKLDWEGSDPDYTQASWMQKNIWFLKSEFKNLSKRNKD